MEITTASNISKATVIMCVPIKNEERKFYISLTIFRELSKHGRRGGLMVRALVPRASGPRSSSGRGHCVVFLGKTLNSHSASLHPGV